MKTNNILERLYEVSEEYPLQLCITLNPDKGIIKDAMQETAVQFAEWLKTAPKRKVIGSKGGIIQYHVFTMQEQFEIFNNEE